MIQNQKRKCDFIQNHHGFQHKTVHSSYTMSCWVFLCIRCCKSTKWINKRLVYGLVSCVTLACNGIQTLIFWKTQRLNHFIQFKNLEWMSGVTLMLFAYGATSWIGGIHHLIELFFLCDKLCWNFIQHVKLFGNVSVVCQSAEMEKKKKERL